MALQYFLCFAFLPRKPPQRRQPAGFVPCVVGTRAWKGLLGKDVSYEFFSRSNFFFSKNEGRGFAQPG